MTDGDGGASNGQTFNVPVEITEARYGIRVERYAYHTDPGGHGRFRGGNGVYLDYRILSDAATLSASVGRHRFSPWAVGGGHPGTCSYARVFRRDGGVEDYGKFSGVRLARGRSRTPRHGHRRRLGRPPAARPRPGCRRPARRLHHGGRGPRRLRATGP